MKSSVTISARKEPCLLSHLTSDLSYRGIFPDLLWCELADETTVRLRLDLECKEETMRELTVYWKAYLPIQSLVISPWNRGLLAGKATFATEEVGREMAPPMD